jgi:hypothetical protein
MYSLATVAIPACAHFVKEWAVHLVHLSSIDLGEPVCHDFIIEPKLNSNYQNHSYNIARQTIQSYQIKLAEPTNNTKLANTHKFNICYNRKVDIQ